MFAQAQETVMFLRKLKRPSCVLDQLKEDIP